MSVQTEIDRISTAVQNAHLKVIEKGGTSEAPYLVANLESAIDTIPVGEDVTAETTEYTDLLTDLEAAVDALPDAGSGGASVETCSVRIYNTDGTINLQGGVFYSAVENGEIVKKVGGAYTAPYDFTLENVPCNSYLYSGIKSTGYPWYSGTNADTGFVGNTTGLLVFVNAPANGLATVQLYDDD